MDIKTTLKSLMMLGIIAALLGGATYAVFSDTETSIGNQMVAGTIDMAVDGENPWTDTTWSDDLGDMKPCVVHYGEFNITNVGVNPMNLWKKLTITDQNGGAENYQGASSEPEYVAGFDGTKYIERCNIAAFTLYDMTVVNDGVTTVILTDDQEVRLDCISGTWIYLGELASGKTMNVNQSYHLSSWADAREAQVGNWAQGDVLTFDVMLYGEQITGPGKDAGEGSVILTHQDGTTWVAYGNESVLTYDRAAETFNYDFEATGLEAAVVYDLIYYADDWPGNNPGAFIGTATADANGALTMSGEVELNMDMPHVDDENHPVGAKIWLVTAEDYDETNCKMIYWNPADYLFSANMINYDDTGVPAP